MALAVAEPALGQVRVSNELRKRGLTISPAGVSGVWQRHGLETFKKRLVALERKVAEEGVILTEGQLAALERQRHDDEATGEIETEHPGYLGSQDTFYVGTLKGVGASINRPSWTPTRSGRRRSCTRRRRPSRPPTS